jgi:hypothetical protein
MTLAPKLPSAPSSNVRFGLKLPAHFRFEEAVAERRHCPSGLIFVEKQVHDDCYSKTQSRVIGHLTTEIFCLAIVEPMQLLQSNHVS